MKIITDKNSIDKIFNRGIVTEVLPSKEDLYKVLLSGRRLKIYIGADPTSDALHLSHAKNYMLLEELRQLGHETIVLFGDFTARIGDPTNRISARPQLSIGQIKKNMKKWVAQIKPLMDFRDTKNPPKILYNSAWLSKLSFKDALYLGSQFTVQQMIERDMFQKRIQANSPIYMHEFLYPILQGYDSVFLNVDIELCGTDQIFNALIGRTLLRRIKNKEKFIIAVNLMENPKTRELMSKSRGVGVFLSSPPAEMFGAIMAQPDEMIEVFFVNNTRIPLDEKDAIMALGPRLAKERVAFEIVKTIYGEKKANYAKEQFRKAFKEHEVPDDIKELHMKAGESLAEILVREKILSSKAEWRRLIKEGAIRDAGKSKITDQNFSPRNSAVLKIGKKRFVKIVII